MPKLLVLYDRGQEELVRLAEAAVEGARSVRFAEVDARGVEPPVGATSSAAAMHELLAHHDGIVLVLPPDESLEEERPSRRPAGDSNVALLEAKAGGAVIVPAADPAAARLAAVAPLVRLGMVVVPQTESGEQGARALGRRVMEVIGWMTHVRAHQHGHHH